MVPASAAAATAITDAEQRLFPSLSMTIRTQHLSTMSFSTNQPTFCSCCCPFCLLFVPPKSIF